MTVENGMEMTIEERVLDTYMFDGDMALAGRDFRSYFTINDVLTILGQKGE